MGESKQKGYRQTNLAVLADREVCVTVGMGCGKKAVPETSGVPEGLCYSWASRSLVHYASCLEACLLRWLGSIWDRASGMVAACPRVHPVRLTCNPPTLLCCMGLVLPGCTGTFSLETHSFPTGFVWAAPQCSEGSSCPRAQHPASFGCWGVLGTGCGPTAENSFQGACSQLKGKMFFSLFWPVPGIALQ